MAMDPMELAAKKKGLKHLIKGMAVEMSKGRADTPMAAGGVKDAVGDAMEAAHGDPDDHDEDQAEDALEGGAADDASEGAPGEHGDEGTEEPAFHDQVKSFMQKPLHSNHPSGPGDKVVVRMIAGEARPVHGKGGSEHPGRSAPPPGKKKGFTGRR